ncbi:MAG TPA: oxygen-independent coproporphyrinogen III oxidase [Balneolales bacterium]|nr:oxygen-independent coproporphyrinogen III oxidase [Balneolales bacterium]
MSVLHFDINLAKKYATAGPRYTSYPTALKFTDCVDRVDLLHEMRVHNRPERPLSLYFHLPFCYSLCWFCGCTQVITHDQSKSSRYIDYLMREMRKMRLNIHPVRKAVQMHWGGGTPTFLRPDEIRELGSEIQHFFPFDEKAEVSVEIDPRRLTEDHVKALREVGFNRASMGVQDINPEVQEAVHRFQTHEHNTQALDWLHTAGFHSVNMDLIYGLPHQTAATFEKTLDVILEYNPDRLAVYNYAHVPWMRPAQKLLNESALPDPEEKIRMLKLIVERLTGAGYVYIGMDHFAKYDDELAEAQRQKKLQRNFQGYSTHAGTDIYAFGMSSISQVGNAYYQNVKDLKQYYDHVSNDLWPLERGYILNRDDQIRHRVIMELMCNLELDYDALSRELDIDFRRYFRNSLNQFEDMESDGLLEVSDDRMVVSLTGRLFIRNIAMKFDAYLGEKKAEKSFSQTV